MSVNNKFKMAKCPYCGTEYDKWEDLTNLAIHGWNKKKDVKCKSCGENFALSVKITYYASKCTSKK